MIVMIFEFEVAPEYAEQYAAESARMRALVGQIDGFEGIERFRSEHVGGRHVALGYFRDEDAVRAWRTAAGHRRAQALGRARYFTDYRLRMAEVRRDYGPHDRGQAPTDSRRHHDGTEHPCTT